MIPGRKYLTAGFVRVKFCGVTPSCFEKARVKPSWESKTKSKATSTILTSSVLSRTAARDNRTARMYSNGLFPVRLLKTLAACHGEYPAAQASIVRGGGFAK